MPEESKKHVQIELRLIEEIEATLKELRSQITYFNVPKDELASESKSHHETVLPPLPPPPRHIQQQQQLQALHDAHEAHEAHDLHQAHDMHDLHEEAHEELKRAVKHEAPKAVNDGKHEGKLKDFLKKRPMNQYPVLEPKGPSSPKGKVQAFVEFMEKNKTRGGKPKKRKTRVKRK